MEIPTIYKNTTKNTKKNTKKNTRHFDQPQEVNPSAPPMPQEVSQVYVNFAYKLQIMFGDDVWNKYTPTHQNKLINIMMYTNIYK